MTDTAAPSGAEAQPSAVANSESIDTGQAIREQQAQNAKPEESKADEPKTLTVEEELEKLRRAKARDDRRIGKITAQKYQYQKEAEELRAKLSNGSPAQQANQQGGELSPAKTGIPTKLNPNSFNSWADYSEARAEEIADYKFEQKFAEREGKQKESQQTREQQAWIAEREAAVTEKAQEFIKENPDAQAVIEEFADIADEFSPELQRLFLEADNAPLAFYILAKEGKLEALMQMSPARAAMEIGRAQMQVPSKPKTKAPTPLPASRGSVPSGKDPLSMNDAEFNAWRRASLKRYKPT